MTIGIPTICWYTITNHLYTHNVMQLVLQLDVCRQKMVSNTKAQGQTMKMGMTAKTGVLLKMQNICHRKTRTSVGIPTIRRNHGATLIRRAIGVTVIFLSVVSCMI